MSIPTNMTQEPKTADTIEASRVRDHAKQSTPLRYIEGLAPSLSGTTLTILASPKWGVYVGGNLWRRAATEANHTETLTDDATNHVWFASNGNIEVNTSGTPTDPDSVKLYTITVTAGTPVLTTDHRTTIFDFPDGATFDGDVSAPGQKVSADNFEADGTDPELVFIEGAVKRKIRFTGTALQVLDESDNELTADLGDISEVIESKTANFNAESNVTYLVNHATPATRIVATLPQSPAEGDTILFLGANNTAGFRVKENATSTDPIRFLSSVSAGTGSDYWQTAAAWRALRVTFQGGDWRVVSALGTFTNTAAASESGVPDDAVSNVKLANMATQTIKGRTTAGTGDPEDLTATQAANIVAGADVFIEKDGSVAFTGNQSFGGNKATNLADGTADADGAAFGQVKGAARLTQDGTDTTTDSSSGDVISSGYVELRNPGSGTAGALPGYMSIFSDGFTGAPIMAWFESGGKLPMGTRLVVKGRAKASAATQYNGDYELFGIGVVSSGDGDGLGNVNEVTRDDVATVAVVVDAATQSIQKYNNTTAGDASYTDSGFDADIVAGFDFEMEVLTPITTDNSNDTRVTIRIRDSGGTLRTIHSNVAPALSANNLGWNPVFLINGTDGYITKLTYEVQAP